MYDPQANAQYQDEHNARIFAPCVELIAGSHIARTLAGLCEDGTGQSRASKASRGVKRGWIRALRFDLRRAYQSAALAEDECSRAEMTDDSRVEADLLWSFIHAANDDASRALDRATMAARRTGNVESTYAAAVLCRAAHWLMGDLAAFNVVGRPTAPNAGRTMTIAALSDRSVEAAIELQQLRLPMAARVSRAVIAAASAAKDLVAVTLLPSVIIAQLAYEQGHLAEADAALCAVLPRIRSTGTAEAAVRAYTTLARAAIRRRRGEFAAAMLREGEALGEDLSWPRLTAACSMERMDQLVDMGRMDEAEAVFERLVMLDRDEDPLGGGRGIGSLVELARCRIASIRAPSEEQAASLRRLLAEALSRGDILLGVRIGVRLAASLSRASEAPAAANVMAQLVDIACHAGLFQTILDGEPEVRHILRALRSTSSTPHIVAYVTMLLEHWSDIPPDPIIRVEKRSAGVLSPRERSVLHLMSLGQSNKQIAQRMGIAPETVKSHAKHIFERLGSSTRAEAVSRATSLAII